MYVICASPLAKLFINEFQTSLMDNFEQVFDDKIPFTIKLKTSNGVFRFEYNTPKLMGPKPTKDGKKPVGEIDWPHFTEWLCGGDSGMEYHGETASTGIVKLPVQNQVTDLLAAMIESGEKPTTKIEKAVRDSRTLAKTTSEMRVRYAAQRLYEAYRKQTEIAKEDNKTYIPTPTEYLCVKLLSETIKSKEGPKARMAKEVDEMMAKLNDAAQPGV